MRLFILGATGNTGTQLIDLALARGHQVTAFARSPEKITRQHPSLTCVRGNPLDVEALAKALPGHDAVLSAIGVRPPRAFRAHSTVQEVAASTVAAMTRARVSRLGIVSVAVLFPLKGWVYGFFRWVLRNVARDQACAEAIVKATPLAWTIARPPRLVNKRDERYLSERDGLPNNGRALSFRAVAAFLLDSVEQGTHVHETVGLAGPS